MKFLYVIGLEHSGTTLLSHLLSQHPRFLGLGEVGPFLSKDHMDYYLRKWGEYPDATLCSCGSEWDDCDFWGDLIHLAGHQSETTSLVDKYRLLFKHVRDNYPEDTVLVDSSKSISTLKLLIENKTQLGLDDSDIFVVYAVKDVRNFATSIANKEGSKSTLLANYRSFNWWVGENVEIFRFLEQSKINFWLSLYDTFCHDVEVSLHHQFERLGYQPPSETDVSHSNSHIAIGNKNFIVRNRGSINYDARWKSNTNARVAYFLHRKARLFNERLYEYRNYTRD